MILLHTGQTGVERGADRAARAVGMPIEGCCAFERRDELGPLPPEIAADLTACDRRGARSALRATLQRADLLVIGVPDASHPNDSAGVEALRRAARRDEIPQWTVDLSTDFESTGLRIRELEQTRAVLRVLMTGPRLTRWRDGERLGWRMIAQTSLTPTAVTSPKHRVLVVDANRNSAEMTCWLLRTLGHQAVSAASGMQGIEVAAKLDPDVGFFALGLPDIDGYDLARRIRSMLSHPLFLTAITGSNQAHDAGSALLAGFDRHVVNLASAETILGVMEQASNSLLATAVA